jgi:ABC-type transport system involved in multi-copper enzyme maturation permease subunit
MFWNIFRFELYYHSRQPLIYIVSLIFFLLAFLATTSSNVTIGGGTQNLNLNAPFVILQTLSAMSLLCLFSSVAYSANPVLRDFDHGTAEMFFSTGINKFSYLFGRLGASLIFSCIVYFGAVAGVMLGEFMPWLDQDRIGPFRIEPYLFASWAFAIPNIIMMSSVFFCLATITRRLMSAYVGCVGLLMIFFVINAYTEPDTIALTSKLDPFGLVAFGEVTRYWTVFEKNQSVPLMQGSLLIDRVLWMGISAIFLFIAYWRFNFSLDTGWQRPAKGKEKSLVEVNKRTGAIASDQNNRVSPVFSLHTQWQQYLSQTRIEMRNIFGSIAFKVLLVFGLFNVVASALGNLGDFFGTSVYPTTGFMLTMINGAYSLSLVIVLIYYSAELLVREKETRVAEIIDALPYPNWIMIGAKLTSLVLVMISMLLVAMIAAIGMQIYSGYYQFDIPLYLEGLLVYFNFPIYLMCVVGLFLVVLTQSKNLAMLLMVVYFVSLIALPQMGLQHHLYGFSLPRTPYSAFTGFGHNAEAVTWYSIYWGFAGCVLLLLTHLLWPRGIEESLQSRLRLMKQRASTGVILASLFLLTGFIATGAYIFYNTNVLNEYVTTEMQEKRQAGYETAFKQYQYQEQVETKSVYVEVDIYPDQKEAAAEGHYIVVNDTAEPMQEIHISTNPTISIEQLDIPGTTLTVNDEELGYRVYKFEPPLAPDQHLKINFKTAVYTPGFVNHGQQVSLSTNGSFFNNTELLPSIGYQQGAELLDNSKRRKYELPPAERAQKIDDVSAWNKTVLGSSSRVNFETVVSTSMEQTAIAPGYLQKQWEQDGRRYFHYKMDAPIWNFYSYLSADYQVRKDQWNDVSIEVYYKHEVNVDTMIHSTKQSLAYFTENFSPYQYRQFRILEFPSFRGRFAQSFPNTIPFSESIGFIADLRDKNEIDYVFYVTAHELAHQWWAHQVIGANVQGATMIVESLAQYFALMVMEQEYGKDHMQRFLKYELDRYLSGRGSELLEEQPLMLVENQSYIHYRKGSVNLYALRDYIGEEAVNEALRRFIAEYAFQDAPYPTAKHLLSYFREVAPDQYQPVITDLFEKIVLYDLSVNEASVTELPGGGFEVTMQVNAKKFEADGEGRETEVPVDGYFDIAVLGEESGESNIPKLLYMEKYHINEQTKTITLVVDEQPVTVGIDPYNKMIDRNPEDNRTGLDG